jgi:shikimate kinase
MKDVLVTLIGPGGAGKTTIARAIAERLRIDDIDLDQRFRDRAGDISEYIDGRGYNAYARENVETYRLLSLERAGARVVALSSGFITYPDDVHPDYARLCTEIVESPGTIVLLPSLDFERCVAETVRRQLSRPFARSPMAEAAVIRERFARYLALPVMKIETMRPVAQVVDTIVKSLRLCCWHQSCPPPTARR